MNVLKILAGAFAAVVLAVLIACAFLVIHCTDLGCH